MAHQKHITRGEYTFTRIKDGVYLAYRSGEKKTFKGTVFTNDPRGRSWSVISPKGETNETLFKSMTAAVQSVV